MMPTTIATESTSVRSTSWIAPSMKTASSPVTKMRTPSGSSPASSATTARTPSEIAERVALRLADDAEAEPALAVRAQDRVADVGPERDDGHVRQPGRVVDHQRLERLGRVDRRGGADDEALVRRLERSRRPVEGDVFERVAHVGDRQPAARQRHLVDVDAEDALAAAVDLHVGDAGHRDQPVDDAVLDEVGQALDRHGRGGHPEPHHRLGVGVGLDDPRLVGVVGKLVQHPADRVAGVGRRDVEVGRAR